jgi:hypothetical protein
MPAARAIREFIVEGDPWPTVDAWAGRAGYHPAAEADGRRTYRKGSGFWTGKRLVEVTSSGNQLHVEACVSSGPFARAMSLFILPSEITVESGGPKAIVPRKMGRNELNDLMQAFGQDPIH